MTHTTESIKSLLETSNAAVERALQVLYERQTADEQASEQTSHSNGVGFSAVDAEILSSFACQVNAKVGAFSDYLGRPRKIGETLTPKQMTLARRKVMRYAKQLAEAANAKGGAKEEPKKATGAREALPVMMPAPKTLQEKLAQLEEEYKRESVRPVSYRDGRPLVNILYFQVQELKQRIAKEEQEAKVIAAEATSLVVEGKSHKAGELIEAFVAKKEQEREVFLKGFSLEATAEKAPKPATSSEFSRIRDRISEWTLG